MSIFSRRQRVGGDGRFRGIDGLLGKRIENEVFALRRNRTRLFDALSGFVQAFHDLDADGGIVGFALKDLVGPVTVVGNLYGANGEEKGASRRRRSRREISEDSGWAK